MESNSLGSRGLRLKLRGILAHGKLHRQADLGNNYLRQHVGGGVGSHLDRRCEKPESLRFAHEGQRMVAGVDLHLCILPRTPYRQWIRRGSWAGNSRSREGGICVLVEIELRYVAIPVWPALAGSEMSGTNAASFQQVGRSSLRTPCQKERQLCKYTQPCPNVVADSCIIEQHAYIPTCLTTAFEQVPLADISPFTASKIQCSASIWTLPLKGQLSGNPTTSTQRKHGSFETAMGSYWSPFGIYLSTLFMRLCEPLYNCGVKSIFLFSSVPA
jgi:hypothetical protein